MSSESLLKAQEKMQAAGVHKIAIDAFSRFYSIVEAGDDSYIHESDIEPLTDVTFMDDVLTQYAHEAPGNRSGSSALSRTAMLKLNGGLGTSMGLQQAKSLLEVRDGKTFLDFIVDQVLWAREAHQVPLPLMFLNSFRTEADTLAALAPYATLPVAGLPLSLLQNQEPKISEDTLAPVSFPQDPELEWCPPGHGDVYTVLATSGVLTQLAEQGFEFLNISNVDNLGAAPSAEIAQWFEESGAPFAAETVRRTPADRKGGAVVVRDGQLILRETAQITDEDAAAASNISKHKYFNANTLWIRISALLELLETHHGFLPLPLIQNHKTVDPTDPDTERVIQLESAMGAAIELFDGARALVIDRSRFLPVKTTNDLMLLRSDVYEVDQCFRLNSVHDEPLITLDPEFFGIIADFEERFENGIPSLAHADSLTVEGPWRFGANIEVLGDAALISGDGEERYVEDGQVLDTTHEA